MIHYRSRHLTVPITRSKLLHTTPIQLPSIDSARELFKGERITKSNRRLFAVNELTRLSNHRHAGDRVLSVEQRSRRGFPLVRAVIGIVSLP